MLLFSQMDYCSVCMFIAINEPWHFIFPLLKFLLIFLLLIFLYNFFVKPRIFRKSRNNHDLKFSESKVSSKVRIELLKNETINPSVISVMIRNTGNRDVNLEAPVLVFKRWVSKRKFRILSVDYSETYPMFLENGKASAINIELEQFYHFAPELRKAHRISVEMKEVDGRKFQSRTIRLKCW